MPLYLPRFNLQNYNTLASPVHADFFVSVKNEVDLLAALRFATERQLPLLVLGGGSNVVLHDDFPGLVIHVQLFGKELISQDDEFFYVKAAAGENWSDFVDFCLDEQFWGLENLSLIPGSVGAAPIQNIGAYGVELKDVFSELTAIEVKSGLSVTFTHEACQFGYRDSVFKNSLKDQFIITSVTFKLHQQPQLITHYPALQAALDKVGTGPVTPELISHVVCDIRRSKLPDPRQLPNVGSFFKNPIVTREHLADIQRSYPDVIYYAFDNSQVKLAAGWLIERAGWKAIQEGACVHPEQALVLTNPKRLSGAAVLDLAARIERSIMTKFGVELEQEPRSYPEIKKLQIC